MCTYNCFAPIEKSMVKYDRKTNNIFANIFYFDYVMYKVTQGNYNKQKNTLEMNKYKARKYNKRLKNRKKGQITKVKRAKKAFQKFEPFVICNVQYISKNNTNFKV
jgi:hypothetical protein